MVRVIICGGREWTNEIDSFKFLDRCDKALHITTVISGHARGADKIGERWATANLKELKIYPADWKKHDKAAGPIRNQQMLDEAKPDYVIAFPGGTGTAHMKRIAKEANVPIAEYEVYQGMLNK